MNTRNHIGKRLIICSKIRMCEIYIYPEFYHGIIYIANEGRRVRILNIYINNIMMFICVFMKYNILISAFVLFQQFGV
jgi:hypothetical protein